MSWRLLFTLAVISVLFSSTGAMARDHHHHRGDYGHSSVYFNFSYPWYPHRYYYVAPPPVVYAAPTYYAPAPAPVYYPPAAVVANQTSPTFIDNYGRTCRQFQTSSTGGTACLQADGTWRVVY